MLSRLPFLVRYLIRKNYAKPGASKFLGEHRLTVDGQGFTHAAPYAETRYAWGVLERIEAEANHTYWYISANQAIVIPHQELIEGSLPELLLAAKQNYRPGQTMNQRAVG